MNKLFKRLGVTLLGFALAAGVGVGVASNNLVSEVNAASGTYSMVTNASALNAGDIIVLECNTKTAFAGAMGTNAYLSSKDKLADAIEITLGGSSSGWTLTTSEGTIRASAAKKMSLTQGTDTWTISIANDGTATITSTTSSYGTIGYNAGAPRFLNYTSAQTPIQIYKKSGSSKTLTGISVKTPPSKTEYISGEQFDASGLVITATYSEGNPEDIAYDDYEHDFSFNPTTITSSGNVTITYGGKDTTQAVSIVSVTDITGVESAPSSVGLNKSIPLDEVVLSANLSNGSTTTVNPTSISCDTSSVGKKTATATYSPATGVKTATFSIDVEDLASYDLSKISGFSGWSNSYGQHIVESTNITGATAAATLDFKIANKQSSGVGSTYPCIGTKTTKEVVALEFTLKETGKKISSVSLMFVQRGTNKPTFYLHKGSGIETDALTSLKIDKAADAEVELSYSNVNDTVFTLGYNGNNSGSNVAAGLKSITIGLSDAGGFGTLDHISVSKKPNVTVYHVDESLSYEGMTVTAYDGADESTANFKDVTEEISTSVDEGYVFLDQDIGEFNVNISYEDKNTILPLTVYAKAEYELVTSEPADWSGNYIIVGSYTDEDGADHNVAMTSTLTSFDAIRNYKEIDITSTTVVAGQESEFTIAAYSGGYSIQGKSGKFFGGPTADSNGLVTSDTALKNIIEYSDDNVLISSTASTPRHLRVEYSNGEGRFRYYKTGDGVQLYKLKESSQAGEYADKFLAAGLCDGGTTAPSTTKWNELAADYALLNKADKEIFRLGVASETGTNIQQCLARYDLIVSKYGKTTYSDFMNRDPQPLAGSLSSMNNVSNSTMMIVIVSVAVASISLLGVTIFLKKKRAIH